MSAGIKSIYTDGACSGNPGPGGWGVVIYFADGTVHELGGKETDTTNNRMELQAAIAGLEFLANLPAQDAVALFTDSQYVQKGITQWVPGWKRKGWKTAKGQPVLNQDLWEQLDRLNQRWVDWRYVRGHSGNEGNERCDQIAHAFSQGQRPKLKQRAAVASIAPAQPSPQESKMAAPPEQERVKSSGERQAQPVSDALEPLQTLMERLRLAHEIASEGYVLTSGEVAALTEQPLTTVDQQPETWQWRNWSITKHPESSDQLWWVLKRMLS